MIDKLINKNELSKEFNLKPGSIRNKSLHKKHSDRIKELNDLINYWRNRNE